MKSCETETFTRPDILSLGGTETGTETRKVSVPRVSAPRPPISGEGGGGCDGAVKRAANLIVLLHVLQYVTVKRFTKFQEEKVVK